MTSFPVPVLVTWAQDWSAFHVTAELHEKIQLELLPRSGSVVVISLNIVY